MAKTPVQTQDLGDAIAKQGDSFVSLSKITVPYTTVVNRAKCTDFSQDLLPRMGIDRVMTQSIIEVQGEVGPNGERVFKPVNDAHDAVRFVGNFSSSASNWGQMISSVSVNDYIEITFYGTGLNILVPDYSAAYQLYATVDGGAESGTNIFTGSGASAVLQARNYSSNQVRAVVSGLTLGLHTVKLRNNFASGFNFYGYEVLNTNTTLQLTPGNSYANGKRLYKSSLTTDSYNSNFESGSLGSRGGHVVVYQKSDGSIAKAVTPTNTSSATLSSADHTNEEVIRKYHYREFGAGRSDDFSLTLGARAFTIDDGTTTLVLSNGFFSSGAGLASGIESFTPSTTADYFTITFVGTGLDIMASAESTSGTLSTYTVSVDGATAVSMTLSQTTPSTTYKIVSGLPYGTHTARFTISALNTTRMWWHSFIAYGPKKPVIPTGAIELSDYFVMADYSRSTTITGTSDVGQPLSTGVIYKSSVRELAYGGTWSITSVSAGSISGSGTQTSTNTDYLEYVFFGTGIEIHASYNATPWTATIQIDGVAYTGAANVAYISSPTPTWTPGSSTFLVGGSNGASLQISGLALGMHKIKMTKSTATDTIFIRGVSIITPIHSPKDNGPYIVQNTLPIGSQGIRDNRKFGNQLTIPKSSAQAVGVTSSPTSTSTSYVPLNDMSVTIKTTGNPIEISTTISALSTTSNADIITVFYVDGIQVGIEPLVGNYSSVNTQNWTLNNTAIVPVSPGIHKIDVYVKGDVGGQNLTFVGTRRILKVREI